MGSSMENDDLSNDENIDDKDIESVCNTYWAYPDENVVFNDFRNNQPLCLVCTNDGKYGAMICSGKIVNFDFPTNRSIVTVQGIEFFDWQPQNCGEFDKESISFSCVLLPLQVKEGTSVYAAIREDYTMLTENGEFK